MPLYKRLLRKLELEKAPEAKRPEIRAYHRGHDRGCWRGRLEMLVLAEVVFIFIGFIVA